MARQRKGKSERRTAPRKSLDHVRVDRLGRVIRKTVVDGHEREIMSAWVARPRRRRKGGRPPGLRPGLTIERILSWADDHRHRTGDWPTRRSGSVLTAFGEKWSAIDRALQYGRRGLPRGSSLANLLYERRGYRYQRKLPPLRKGQILAWADAFHERRGRWPTHLDGPIDDAPGETWTGMDGALNQGHRGLPGGDTLRGLLHERRGVFHHKRQPKYTIGRILSWADAHYRRSGRWPNHKSGAIPSSPTETWAKVDTALIAGTRGLRGKSSLAKLLAERRGVRNPARLPTLSIRQILRWADEHRRQSGRWPSTKSGAIPHSGGETWSGIDGVLRKGTRGLSPGDSISRLLQRARGVANGTVGAGRGRTGRIVGDDRLAA